VWLVIGLEAFHRYFETAHDALEFLLEIEDTLLHWRTGLSICLSVPGGSQ
jgi:hypothetical protein